MTNFTPLSIHNGYGNVHINRFRISVRAPLKQNQINWVGARILNRMPYFMDSSTASVEFGDYPWMNNNSLKFRGVARIQPFSVPIKIPILGIPVEIPVPDVIRDWMMPDVHTDSVGMVALQDTGMTVQTLKREFEDKDDKAIRAAVTTLLTSVGALGGPLGEMGAKQASKHLGDIAVYYNQHHFLAGRRAFRFDVGSSFGYGDDRLIFETVAIERFSSILFASSQLAMGSIPALVRDVWGQMLMKFCAVYGLTVITDKVPPTGWSTWQGKVHYLQMEVSPSVADIRSNSQFWTMNEEHREILEKRP
jgi:hypothetical protein